MSKPNAKVQLDPLPQEEVMLLLHDHVTYRKPTVIKLGQ